jgi:Cdc6-like AAA superfamily ATPase
MPEQKAYRFFLGANSPDGFYSFYDQLIDLETAKEVYIIKGGPGTGKSSFMRRASKYLTEAGITAEYINCSADPNSLDGIVFPDISLAFVDGTAPHAAVPMRQ